MLKSVIKSAALKRKIRHSLQNRKELRPPKYIEKIGVLVDLEAFANPSDFLSLKEWKGVASVEIMVFSNLKKEIDNPEIAIFSGKNISVSGGIKPGKLKGFVETEFDLLINYTNRSNLTFNYVSAMSQAAFKVGICTENDAFYDLIIKTPINDNTAFEKELQKYLRILKMLKNE